MQTLPRIGITLAAGLLAACSGGQSPSPHATANATSASTGGLVANAIDHALDRAEQKLRTRNITISNADGSTGQPSAAITPQGDLIVNGKRVPLTASQHTEVLAYRQQLVQIAHQGMEVGKEGAALGMRATGTALAAALSGKPKHQIRQQVESEASGVRRAAAKICERLPALMASQQKLARDVPAFKPYATLTQARIDRCRTDALAGGPSD